MDIFKTIAERKITEAIKNGEFDDLSGKGKRLEFDDETWVPDDLRMSYRVLRNAGCVPPELELRNEIINLRNLLDTIDDDKERLKKMRELQYKIMQVNLMRRRPLALEHFPLYEERVIDRIVFDENS
jgi:hypothetical protein